jgi:hypothetical protein
MTAAGPHGTHHRLIVCGNCHHDLSNGCSGATLVRLGGAREKLPDLIETLDTSGEHGPGRAANNGFSPP